MLVAQGIITEADGHAIQEGLARIEKDIATGTLLTDTVSNIEAGLVWSADGSEILFTGTQRHDWDVRPAETEIHAVRTDGTLWCWGLNDFGQLGIGASAARGARSGGRGSWRAGGSRG